MVDGEVHTVRESWSVFSFQGIMERMNSISPECNELKHKYDDCFNAWFTERFLKGDSDDSVCAGLLKAYQHCVRQALEKQQIDLSEVEKDVMNTSEDKSQSHPGGKPASGS